MFIVANVRMLPIPVLPMSNSTLKFNRPLIGNWNWQWQHFHIGNIRMDRETVPTDANDLFRDARARAPLLHLVLQIAWQD